MSASASPRRSPSAFAAGSLACLLLALGLCAGSAAAAPLSISVSGNHFVNGAGQTIRLLGVNHQSSEYACAEGYGYNDGHMNEADAAAIASWNANAVRVPVNEDCWLGINGQPNNSQSPPEELTQAGYQHAIESYVAALNAHGLYAILDLHWSAPGAQVALEQQPMPDYDHSLAFWQSVALAFKGNPAVVFDIFNEPYDPTDPRSGSDMNPADQVSWNCWQTGTENGPAGGANCETSAYDTNQVKTSRYRVAGMQTLLDTIRATGATEPVLAGGLNFANDLSQWAGHAPKDPLNQEAASFHNYQGQACSDISCWNSQIAPVAGTVPVVTGEFDGENYAESHCTGKAPSSFDQEYMNWADQHGVGFLAWGWVVLSQAEKDSQGCNAFYLIEDYAGTPAAPNGTVLHAHLLTLPPGGLTATAPVGTSPMGTSPAGGGTAPGLPAVALQFLKETVRPGGASVAFALHSPVNCAGVLSGLTANAYAARPAGHARRPIQLGTVHFTLTAGRTKTVVLTLSRTARQLLAAKHTLRVRITITLSSAGHSKTVIVRALTLRLPVRHGH